MQDDFKSKVAALLPTNKAVQEQVHQPKLGPVSASDLTRIFNAFWKECVLALLRRPLHSQHAPSCAVQHRTARSFSVRLRRCTTRSIPHCSIPGPFSASKTCHLCEHTCECAMQRSARRKSAWRQGISARPHVQTTVHDTSSRDVRVLLRRHEQQLSERYIVEELAAMCMMSLTNPTTPIGAHAYAWTHSFEEVVTDARRWLLDEDARKIPKVVPLEPDEALLAKLEREGNMYHAGPL